MNRNKASEVIVRKEFKPDLILGHSQFMIDWFIFEIVPFLDQVQTKIVESITKSNANQSADKQITGIVNADKNTA